MACSSALGEPQVHAHEVAGLGLHPDAVELEVEHAFLHQDELLLGRMDVHRHELAGIAVRLEGKACRTARLGKIALPEDVQLAPIIGLTVAGDVALQIVGHGLTLPPLSSPVQDGARDDDALHVAVFAD